MSEHHMPTKNVGAQLVTSCRCIRNPILSVVLFKRKAEHIEGGIEHITWYFNHECNGFGEGHYGMDEREGKEDFLKRLKSLL
ncbi:MAG TPA: hypothetical protein ENI36_03215 [Thermoplasmatales archaeon]|nr:hypothetical protein [Thermoplasmatales archaeon]